MTRPFYESSTDRVKEQEVINLFCEKYKLTAAKLKPSLVVDYGLEKDGHLAYVAEVKVRHKSYPSMFISLHKVQEMRQYVAWGVQARVIFALPQGVYVQKLEFPSGNPAIQFEIGIRGRTDRGDAADLEPVVFMPMAGMTKLFDSKKEWFA